MADHVPDWLKDHATHAWGLVGLGVALLFGPPSLAAALTHSNHWWVAPCMIVGAISLVFGVVLFLLPTMAELTGRYVIEHAAPAPPAGAPVPDSRPEPPVPSATAIKAILKAELREALPSMSASLQLSRRPEHPFPTAKWRQLGDDLASVDPAAHETFARAYGVVAYINGNVLYDGMREALSGAEYDALEEGEGVVRSVVEGV